MCEILNKGNQAFKSLGKEDLLKKLQAHTLDYSSLVTSISPDISETLVSFVCINLNQLNRVLKLFFIFFPVKMSKN